MAANETTGPIAVKKACKDGCIGISVTLKASGWGADRVKVDGGTDLTTAQARELARALVEAADQEDAKLARKTASEERGQKWRDREVAAGRLKIISAQEFLNGR